MTSTTVSPGSPAHGGTAIGGHPDHSRHLLGSAVRAVRVFAKTVVEVVILGNENQHH
jgi:hypothetical protein